MYIILKLKVSNEENLCLMVKRKKSSKMGVSGACYLAMLEIKENLIKLPME